MTLYKGALFETLWSTTYSDKNSLRVLQQKKKKFEEQPTCSEIEKMMGIGS